MITALRNARIFAPEDLGLRSLILGGGRILWMGDPEAAPKSGAWLGEDLDLEGALVIPGLVDGHVHPTGGGGEAGPETRVPAPELSSYTRAGVTSIVGMLGTDAQTRDMGGLCATVRGLRALGIGAWCLTGGYQVPPRTLTGSVRGDITNIAEIIGVGELALSDFRSSQPTLDEVLRIASEAQVAGMLTGKAGVVHLHMGDGPRRLELVRAALKISELPPRVFHPTHVNRQPELFEEALQLVQQGCTIDVTAFPVGDGDTALTAETALGQYLDAGLPADRITISSDSGGCLPVFDGDGAMTSMDVGGPKDLLKTAARLVNQGRTWTEVLPAFTSNPARLLRLKGKGRLAVGSDADLVVLDKQGNPSSVMAQGQWHLLDNEVLRRGPFEESCA